MIFIHIAINAGHTAKASRPGYGASYKGFHESDITRDVAKALTSKLKKRGHSITNATIDEAKSQNAYLKQVCEKVNAAGVDLFISLHCNASISKLGKGVECYTWKGRQVKEAVKICENLASLGFKNRKVKDGSKLYVVKHTKPKAILVELFFLDHYNDRKLYLDHGAEELAEAIADAIG